LRVTSIERTAYPQLKRLTSARVLHVFFAPTAEETEQSDPHGDLNRILIDRNAADQVRSTFYDYRAGQLRSRVNLQG
jgi:hypothetical protein